VEALVALVYDWVPMAEPGRWLLAHCAAQ